MIKKHIEKLKTRSYAEKSNVAFVTSLVLTGIITTLWFITIFSNPSGYFESPDVKVQELANSGSLFDVFMEGVK